MSLLDSVVDDNFSVSEWNRLDRLSMKFDRELKIAYTKSVTQHGMFVKDNFEKVISDCVVETGVTTAHEYGITFNAHNLMWLGLIDELTDNYMRVVDDESAKKKVKEILPNDLSLSDRRSRLDVLGLDARSAVRLERMRQHGISEAFIRQARVDMSLQRGNLIALTEVNRIINATIEALWIDNQGGISKASRKVEYYGEWFKETQTGSSVITTIRGIPSRAVKSIVTRKDNRVCDYCKPLEMVSAKLGTFFNTVYGLFKYPPFHPRCRCFMIVRY